MARVRQAGVMPDPAEAAPGDTPERRFRFCTFYLSFL